MTRHPNVVIPALLMPSTHASSIGNLIYTDENLGAYMVVEAAQASWLGIVASSAVISAIVNVFSNWRLKVGDRKREDDAESRRVGHVYLEIAHQLEAFAKRCDTYIYDINEQLELHYRHDRDAFSSLQEPFMFAFDPAPKWEELPIRFTAEVKEIPNGMVEANEYIHRTWQWSDEGDVWDLECQRVALYGLRAIEISMNVRKEIGAGQDRYEQITAAGLHFQEVIMNWRKAFEVNSDGATLLPALKAQFLKERPPLASSHVSA
ncbi:hypothetical protein QF000_006499 [Paraburkholderia atlantica]|uniref:hypothetical protein n=1 Tax=Paraburkholderia atlantica TaxID=2654982 RepID=UPI003D20BECB